MCALISTKEYDAEGNISLNTNFRFQCKWIFNYLSTLETLQVIIVNSTLIRTPTLIFYVRSWYKILQLYNQNSEMLCYRRDTECLLNLNYKLLLD